ncbi:UNVERIFIED_CONTAM: hypothetical protein GTU68_008602 [Idotea baltica]|nr:hypothetical protein [Idotea baltica]
MNINLNLFISGLLVILTIITIASGVRIVPQGYRHIVQRLGKYKETLSPGLTLIIPFVDKVAYKLTTKDIVLDIPSQEVITQDNVVITANAVAYINILSPEKAVYGIESFTIAIENLVQTALRSIVGELKLDEALSSRERIKASLKEAISDDIADWGITLKTVEIQDINPSATMQTAMEEQAAAERQRRAAVTRSEGAKQAAILEAEGRLEASSLEAKAQIVLANASREAIELVTQAVGDKEMPILYLLGEKYVSALDQLAQSPNAKTILIPADLPAALRGIISKIS